MATKWINNFVDAQGEWLAGQAPSLEYPVTVNFGGASVRIEETSVSGSASIFTGTALTTVLPEVFLNIQYTDGTSAFLSAPVRTPVHLDSVASIDLVLLIPVAIQGAAKAGYNIFVNAHAIYA